MADYMAERELSKQVNEFYINRYKEAAQKRKNAEQKAAALQELYEQKCNEVERLELIVDLLFKRLEK